MINIDNVLKLQEEMRKEDEEFKQHLAEVRRQDLEKQGLKLREIDKNSHESFHKNCDHPNTMENGPATFLYILVMLGGTIFNDRWLIWIAATIIYFRFITRHER